jgi:hypothetical protein
MWWGSSDATVFPLLDLSLFSLSPSRFPHCKMASEPTEDAIANFVSFTSTTREQAINFLKVSAYTRLTLDTLPANTVLG